MVRSLSWAIEYGTFWSLETGKDLPSIFPAQVEVNFEEVGAADLNELALAMNTSDQESILRRLEAGRRCFVLRTGGQIITYGWLTLGAECVGEMERQFHFRDDEAYIWDCGTVQAWQRQGGYSALLSQMIYRLKEEGVPRIWIGASRLNQPSVKGIANAGFNRVVDLTYRRFSALTLLWFREAAAAPQHLIAAANRILLDDHERRIGPLAVGFKL